MLTGATRATTMATAMSTMARHACMYMYMYIRIRMRLRVITVTLTDQASEINYPLMYKNIRHHPEV